MDQLSAHLERGWDLAQRGDTRGAGASARHALELQPESPEVHNLLGFVAAIDAVESAERDLVQAVSVNVRDVELVPEIAPKPIDTP